MKYDFSRYNVLVKGEKNLLFNTRTLALGVLNDETLPLFSGKSPEDLNRFSSDQLQVFLANGFIIPAGVSELDILKKEYWDNKVNHEAMHLSLLTTLNCNFKCIYCFEERRNVNLDEDAQARISKFIQNEVKRYKQLHVDWYGGEPLLNLEAIKNMSQELLAICEKAKVLYRASITTNGFDLTPEIVAQLSELGVKSAQITLDGPKDLHDMRRQLGNGNGTFERIVSNIKQVLPLIEVNLRINVDKTNIGAIRELFDCLKEQGLEKLNIAIKGVVSADSNPCEDSAVPDGELAKLLIDLYKYAYNLGFNTELEGRLKYVYRNFCIVDLDSQYIIAPDGSVYKCGEAYDSTDPGRVGELTSEGQLQVDKYRRARWDKDPFADEQCVQCITLPLCNGGCLLKKEIKKREGCVPELRYNLEDVILHYYNSLVR